MGSAARPEGDLGDSRRLIPGYPARVGRPLAIALTFVVLAAACTSGDAKATPSPVAQPSADIKRTKLDISYTALVESDVHKVTSKKALTAALDGIRAEVKATNGQDDVATPEFTDESAPNLDDFKKFATAAIALAAKNPQLSADRIADMAVAAMIRSSPDCHTAYRGKDGKIYRSRIETSGGAPAQAPAGGTTVVPGTDDTKLLAKITPEGIGYITFREFLHTGTYDITTQVKKALDAMLAGGAKAWLFDMRGNGGGDPPQTMTSWFLNGEPIMRIDLKNGNGGTVTAKTELRLPKEYQLPMAVILNGSGGSSPEVFALGLKENKRATIVGSRSTGCLGATNETNMSDGSLLLVTVQEFVGAVTGTRYNNVGLPPDVAADDASAVSAATKVLLDQIAKNKP
jgi:C-terminal processing protease CtpA/Prc